MSTIHPLIEGKHGGKRIRCEAKYVPAYKELLEASRRGNYWANLTVLGIKALTSSRLGKNNLFIRPNRSFTPPGTVHKDDFYIVLPGCTAVAERLPNDEYLITNLKVDTAYFEMMQNKGVKPGLYRSERKTSSWVAESIPNNKVLNKDERLVAITDTSHGSGNKAAKTAAISLSKIPGQTSGPVFDKYGFDMHYTPGHERLGGLINYHQAVNPLAIRYINASAIALAKTMFHAKNIDNVQWVSEFGGSAVLTQAMQILVDQGVSLPKHMIFMHRPRTLPHEALKLAQQLELKIGRDFTKTGALDVIGNKGQLNMIYDRVKSGNLSLLQGGHDVIRTGNSAYGLASMVVTAPAIPVILTLGKYLAAGATALKVGEMTLSAVAPDYHAKLMSKIK